MIASIAPFLIFAAFVLLLLVTLSAPIIDPIYLFRLSAEVGAASGKINFGVFGYCVSSIQASILGISNSSDARCSPVRLGYTFDSTVARILGVSGITSAISRTSTALFIINPIAAGLAFFAFLISLFMLHRGRNGTARFSSLLTFGIGGIAAIATTVAFVADIIVVALVNKRIKNDFGDSVSMTYGNAVWMTLGAMVALWLALGGALCGICACGGRNRRKRAATY